MEIKPTITPPQKPCVVNFNVRLFSATVRTTFSGAPVSIVASISRVTFTEDHQDLFLAEHAEAKRRASTAAHYRDILERLVIPALGSRKAENTLFLWTIVFP